jgi:hypothetical protein
MSKPSSVRPASFWKKHQLILQHCAELSSLCNAKILVGYDHHVLRTISLNLF